MTDVEKAKLEAETKAAGGETGDPKTPETDAEFKSAYENQKKRAELAEKALKDRQATEKAAADKAKAEAEAKKAEGENKNNNQVPTDPIELAKMANVLQGMSDKEIEELQAVASAKKLSLAAAKNDPLFQAWHNKFLEDARKERAKMGGSRGSDQAGDESQPTFAHGMKRDEHKKLAEELTGAK